MKRYHQEKDFVRRRARYQMLILSNWAKSESDLKANYKIGKFRKRAPLDCGKTRCRLCHPHKSFGSHGWLKTKAERTRELEFMDSMRDAGLLS